MPAATQPKRRPGRPPKSDGARRETRERLVRCGIEILTEMKKVGVPKGSFYHYFASKDDFGRAVIEGYAAYFARKLDRWLLDESRAPLDRLMDFIVDGKNGITRFEFRRGCLIGNLGQELGGTHPGFRTPIETVFRDWQDRVERCLEAAKAAGDLAPDADCARLAEFFWIGWEGAILRAKLMRDLSPIDLFVEHFFSGLPR
jgi:TetR/AcrR family transcriptional repressor of nem operon